jgi:phage major head subunit gpT-like protein
MATIPSSEFFQTEAQPLFDKAVSSYESLIMPLARRVESVGSDVEHGWLKATPEMRHWEDERVLASIGSYTLNVQNRDYEATVEVDMNALEDDRTGLVEARLSGMVNAAVSHNDTIASLLLANATSTTYQGTNTCFDENSFYNTTHLGTTVNNNIITQTAATNEVLTTAEAKLLLQGAITRFLRFVDEEGRPAIKGDWELVVWPNSANYMAVKEAAAAAEVVTTSNVLAGLKITVISNAYLATNPDNDNIVYCYAIGSQIPMPFIYQVRRDLQLVRKDDPATSDSVFLKRKMLIGVDKRDRLWFGNPQAAIQATVT